MSGMMLSIGQIQADIFIVKKLLAEIESGNKNKHLKSNAAYHLQQAVEKMIKIQIYCSGIPYNNHSVYSHNLVQLTQYAQSIGIQLMIPEYVQNNLVLLSSWEARGRYDVHLMVRIDRLRRCYDVIEKWYKELHEKGFR